MRKLQKEYPWIQFNINLERLPYSAWFVLGQCVSKCLHIRQIPLLPQVRDELHKIYLCKGVHATTAIEGNTLSEQQVRQILEGQTEAPESKKYLQREVENILGACNEIARRLQAGQSFYLTPELLCEYNGWVLDKVSVSDDVVPGKFRTDRRGVGGYRAPEPGDVPLLVEHLCQWFESLRQTEERLNAVAFGILRAIIAHLYIELIHPFADGNGRTGRLVEFTILLSCGVPSPAAHLLSNHYNATRAEYYRQLDRISKTGGDVTAFFEYAIVGLHDGLEEIINFLVAQTQTISWEHYIHEEFRRGPATNTLKRQRDLLITISRQQKPLTRSDIEEIAARVYLESGKTRNAITRDLNDLIGAKWLILEDNQYRPAIERILQRLPFSIQ